MGYQYLIYMYVILDRHIMRMPQELNFAKPRLKILSIVYNYLTKCQQIKQYFL